MRERVWVILAYIGLAVLFVGVPVAALIINPRYEAPRDVELRELRERAESLDGELAAARDVADSLRAHVRVRVDTVRVYIDAYRKRAGRLQARLDSILAERDAPSAEPATVLADHVTDVLRETDQLADACTRLAGDCEAALEAKDVSLSLADSVRDVEAARAATLERYNQDLARRLRGAERGRWYYALGGVVLAASVCRAGR